MTYATTQDLIAAFGQLEIVQLTDRAEPPAGVIDVAVAGQALVSADSEINAYLGVRYALPLATVPDLVVGLAKDIARYLLWKDRASEEVRKRYDDAVGMLKRLSAGTTKLDIAGVEAPSVGGLVATSYGRRRISRDDRGAL